jgi:hypothetical protein
MSGRQSIVVVEDFYSDPHEVRAYALHQPYYLPYQDAALIQSGAQQAIWWSSWYKPYKHCPFKSSPHLIERLEQAIGERIDMDGWKAQYPVDECSKPVHGKVDSRRACLWNCSFHVKLNCRQKLGEGVHNHVTDPWNSVGRNGWAGIVYLSPGAEFDGGLHLWTNIAPGQRFDWMTPAVNWRLVDSFANIFNRLVLCRGDLPHSGANGWGQNLETGRMFQTFFFHTIPARRWSVPMGELSYDQSGVGNPKRFSRS